MFMKKEEIHRICKKYYIRNYTINPDGSIDVDGNVELGVHNLDKIPLKFNNVSGYFNISYNNITSLEGCPKYIGETFYCNSNKLTSLEYFPNKINHEILIKDNPLESLVGFNEDYDKLSCDNKDELIKKHKRKGKLQIISEL